MPHLSPPAQQALTWILCSSLAIGEWCHWLPWQTTTTPHAATAAAAQKIDSILTKFADLAPNQLQLKQIACRPHDCNLQALKNPTAQLQNVQSQINLATLPMQCQKRQQTLYCQYGINT